MGEGKKKGGGIATYSHASYMHLTRSKDGEGREKERGGRKGRGEEVTTAVPNFHLTNREGGGKEKGKERRHNPLAAQQTEDRLEGRGKRGGKGEGHWRDHHEQTL